MSSFLISLLLLVIPFAPGQTVPRDEITARGVDSFFSVSPIPEDIFSLMKGRSYRNGCTVPRDSLRYLLCLHTDASGRAVVGEMVVGSRIAERVTAILKELFLAGYPIERMRLVDHYGADDRKSMADNNSSSFNFRFISHTKKVSTHGLGLAVDINPLYNPYHRILKDGGELLEPEGSEEYLDRTLDHPYMIKPGDLCCRLFKKYGFDWGGDWKSCKDYQHFELR